MSVNGVGSTGHTQRDRIAIIGSGNWGTAVGKLVAENTSRHSARFFREVKMWTFEEVLDTEKLTELINQTHENVKYLPGRQLPTNLIAVPDLEQVVVDATLLVFVLPPQFLERLLPTIKNKLSPGVRAISLIKGLSFDDEKGVVLISDVIRNGLGKGVDVSVLQGANVANEVADGHFCEATLGYTIKSNAESFFYAFNTPTFRVQLASDPIGVELCGGLKSIIGLGAGMSDGLNYASNSKAAIVRMGVKEMIRFGQTYFSGVAPATFLESCGIASVFVESTSGRSRRCAEIFVRTGMAWNLIEKEVLQGQNVDGVAIARSVYGLLERDGKLDKFPFFTVVYKIALENMDPSMLVKASFSGDAESLGHDGVMEGKVANFHQHGAVTKKNLL